MPVLLLPGCVSVFLQASSILPICLSTWKTPFTNSLSSITISLFLYLLSTSPVTHESSSDLCLYQAHPSTRRQEERGDFQIGQKQQQTDTEMNHTHQFPLHGPQWVIEGEGLVILSLLRRAVCCRSFPLGSCKNRDL